VRNVALALRQVELQIASLQVRISQSQSDRARQGWRPSSKCRNMQQELAELRQRRESLLREKNNSSRKSNRSNYGGYGNSRTGNSNHNRRRTYIF
jgi:hypothetical protein